MAEASKYSEAQLNSLFEWVSYVNYDNPDDPDTSKHIVRLLNRYLDALDKKPKNRLADLLAIGNEITQKMEDLASTGALVLIPDQLPEAQIPFIFADWKGRVGTIYVSLAQFLASELVRRLGRCQYCRKPFVAPDNRKYEYCPKTNHKTLFWRDKRAKSGYHRADMAARRNPDSVIFDRKYLR